MFYIRRHVARAVMSRPGRAMAWCRGLPHRCVGRRVLTVSGGFERFLAALVEPTDERAATGTDDPAHVQRSARSTTSRCSALRARDRRPSATVVVTSIAAPSTSPVMPPKRRTQCATSTRCTPTRQTATGPCHGAACEQASATTRPPRPPRRRLAARDHRAERAARRRGTDRRQAATAATRPAVTRRSATALSREGNPCTDHHHHGPHRTARCRRASPAAPAPAGRSSRDRRRCRPGRRCAGPASRAAAPPQRVRRSAGCRAPNACDAAHTTPAANAPSATPTTGSAVITPRPIPDPARSGSTVPNAKAPGRPNGIDDG